MPQTTPPPGPAAMSSPKLCVLCGFDDDLTAQITQVKNRIRGLLTQIHPALERVLGPRLDHEAVRRLPRAQPSPAQLSARGEKRLSSELQKLAPRMHQRLAADIMPPPLRARVVVPGTASAALVLPRLCAQLQALHEQRAEICAEIEQRVAAHPRCPVLTGQTCVAVRIAARLLTEVVSRDFPSAAHLASYAALAPVTRRSGISIRGGVWPAAAAACSNARCPERPSPPCTALSPAPTTTPGLPGAAGTIRPWWLWPDGAVMCCMP